MRIQKSHFSQHNSKIQHQTVFGRHLVSTSLTKISFTLSTGCLHSEYFFRNGTVHMQCINFRFIFRIVIPGPKKNWAGKNPAISPPGPATFNCVLGSNSALEGIVHSFNWFGAVWYQPRWPDNMEVAEGKKCGLPIWLNELFKLPYRLKCTKHCNFILKVFPFWVAKVRLKIKSKVNCIEIVLYSLSTIDKFYQIVYSKPSIIRHHRSSANYGG